MDARPIPPNNNRRAAAAREKSPVRERPSFRERPSWRDTTLPTNYRVLLKYYADVGSDYIPTLYSLPTPDAVKKDAPTPQRMGAKEVSRHGNIG